MKKSLIAAAALAGFSLSVSAQSVSGESVESAGAAIRVSPLSTNLTLVSDYRCRGLPPSFRRPALQGGFDYAHRSGFYVGNWNSSVSGNQYNNGAAREMDFYGGYQAEPVKDVSADLGLLYYAYPAASIGSSSEKYNNGGLYFGFGHRWFSAKSYTNFAIAKKTTLTLHAGHQAVRHSGHELGVTRALAWYTVTDGAGNSKDIGGTRAVLSLSNLF